MAAIYSGIQLKLKSPQTPWEDKLKLARFAWISSHCLMPNKEQVLLDWCTHALILKYNKRVDFSQDVLDGLWHYLDDVLHSKKLQCYLKKGKTVTLRLNMAQMLLERLQEYLDADSKPLDSVPTVLSVCQGIISSPALSSIFTTKYELLVDLLAKFCSLASQELHQSSLTAHQKTSKPFMAKDELVSEILQAEPVVNLENSQTEIIPPASKPEKPLQLPNVFGVLLQVLSCYLSVQRQQANPNRVFTMVTNQLIQPLVLLRHLLTSGEFTASHAHLCLHQQLCRDIRTKIDSILQLALFPCELLTLYKDELLPVREDYGKRTTGSTKGPLMPVSAALCKLSAQGYCDPSLHYCVKSNTLCLLYKFFLERYGRVKGQGEDENRMLCFYFLTRLIPVLDLHLEKHLVSTAETESPDSICSQQKSPSLSFQSQETWNLALLAVESLLSQTLSADIYNVAADRIRHGERQLGFYRALTQLLCNEAQPGIPSWYRCLKLLLNLNHLILEPDLDQLLSRAWVNAECIEPRVQRAKQLMVCSLLQTYTKLRQLSRLFSELLSVICQSGLGDLRPPLLPEGISTSLKSCLLSIPQSQVLEICSLVMDSIKKCILPDLLKDGTDAEKMEINEEPTDQQKTDASLKLSTLCQLLHAVLFNMKTLDDSSPVPLVKQSKDLMERMQRLIQELHLLTDKKSEEAHTSSVPDSKRNDQKNLNQSESETISQAEVGSLWERRTQEAALLLRYTWIEVDTLFEIHCKKYSSFDSAHSTVKAKEQKCQSSLPETLIESLLSWEITPANLHPFPDISPMSCLLLKLLTLQHTKKILMDGTSFDKLTSGAQLQRAAQFILAKQEFESSLDGDQMWDLQISSLNASSYPVAHWYLVLSNLPLIASHLRSEDMDYLADVLVSSLLREMNKSQDQQHDSLTISLISSEFLQSLVLPELPSLFSALVKSLALRIIHEVKSAQPLNFCRTLQMIQEIEPGVSEKIINHSLSALVNSQTLAEDVQAFTKTGDVFLLLTKKNIKELLNILEILTMLNPDGMNSEDLSSIFLLLFFLLTRTSSQPDQMGDGYPESEDSTFFLRKLLSTLSYLLGGKKIHSVFKIIYGATLVQASVSCLLRQSDSAQFEIKSRADTLDLIKAVQDFIKPLVQLIITRNSNVRLNLDQFTTYLSSAAVESRKCTVPSSGASISHVHLLLACLASFSQVMTSNLGQNKHMDETLTQMLARTNASLGTTVEFILKQQATPQPACNLGQAFIVSVVAVMLHCELSILSVDEENKQCGSLSYMSLYRAFYHQIFREISSAPRPMDFLVSSLNFLSAFYKAMEKTEGETKNHEEMMKTGKEEVYTHILQNVHRLLKAPWLTEEGVCELEPVVQDLLCQLLEKSSADMLNLLLLMVRDGLDICKLKAGNYREVLSAVIIIKLVSRCQLPDSCSKALWLIAPQFISAMVSLIRTSSQDVALTLPFTLPTVTSMTTLLRQGEGFINSLHHVILVLGALQSVPLNHLTPVVYQSAFQAVHEALFAILQCHSKVTLNAAPVFVNVFNRLLVSIMQEGRQRGDRDTDTDVEAYVQCSRLIERMYSHIAAAAEGFTMLSAFMVAQYVTELQKVTLRPDVKQHLTEGVYYILDLCKEQDIKFLMAGLQMGVREVFNDLYSSYTHYHKTQRQGEDKYTV